jgi:hypothetical protein
MNVIWNNKREQLRQVKPRKAALSSCSEAPGSGFPNRE